MLALVPAVSLVICYMTIFESKRTGHLGYNGFLMFGSPILVGFVAGFLCAAMSPADRKRRRRAWYAGFTVGFVYLYLLMYTILNTLGS